MFELLTVTGFLSPSFLILPPCIPHLKWSQLFVSSESWEMKFRMLDRPECPVLYCWKWVLFCLSVFNNMTPHEFQIMDIIHWSTEIFFNADRNCHHFYFEGYFFHIHVLFYLFTNILSVIIQNFVVLTWEIFILVNVHSLIQHCL